MLYGIHVWLCLLITVAASKPGDMSSFFLKAPKSVPRAGRAAPGHYEGFFLKTSKSVPRVGRRNGAQNGEPLDNLYQEFLLSDRNFNSKDNNGAYRFGKSDTLDNNYFAWNPINNEDYYFANRNQLEDNKDFRGDQVDQSTYNRLDADLMEQLGELNANRMKE